MSKRNMKNIALDLYESGGWINIPSIASLGCWCNILIGKRQVGKTYGTLKYELNEGKRFLYLRRTTTEFDAITSDPDLNPFLPLKKEGFDADIVKGGKVTYTIGRFEYEDGKPKQCLEKYGIGMTLPSIANIRGFNGSQFEDVVFDEFIPERIVIKRKAEGDALLNAYVTINGNRELEGKPPLRLWLLANAFDIASPILVELGVVDEIAKLCRTGKEWTVTESGVFIGMPKSSAVSAKRAQTAFMRHMMKNKDSKFYKMAMENQFAYNNLEAVRPMNLKGMKPLYSVAGLYAYMYDGNHVYLCTSRHERREVYPDTKAGKTAFRLHHPFFEAMLNLNQIWCSDVPTLLKIKEFLDIDD
jgi:hypothetical protein